MDLKWQIYFLLLVAITGAAERFFLVETEDNQDIHKTGGTKHVGCKDSDILKNDGGDDDVWKYVHEYGLDYAASHEGTNLAVGTNNAAAQERPVDFMDYRFRWSNTKKKKKKKEEKKKNRRAKKKKKKEEKKKRKEKKKKEKYKKKKEKKTKSYMEKTYKTYYRSARVQFFNKISTI